MREETIINLKGVRETGCICPMKIQINKMHLINQGTAVAQWLRCCATNRKVPGSIPAGVVGISL